MPIKGQKKEGATRHNTPEKNEYLQNYYANTRKGTFKKRVRSSVYAARKRAKQKGMECTIKVEDYPEQTHCSGLPTTVLEFDNPHGKKDTSPSIDRLDPTKGYTPENTWIVCDRVNRIKNDATLEEIEEIARNLRAEMTRRGLIKQ